MALRLCLVGQRIGSSPSAAMQTAAMRACDLEGTYDLRDLAPAAVPSFVQELRDGVYDGCNVTIPYKAMLASACDQLTGDAALVGAVNTIVVDSNGLTGENTDAAGFERALETAGLWPPSGCRAVVLGAGGAAAAVTLALTRAPAAAVRVVARNPAAAEALASRLTTGADIQAVRWEEETVRATLANSDIVVNATSAGLAELPFVVRHLPASCTVADVRYRPRPVDLVAAAAAAGHRACDGLEMLLQQGMLSFTRWTGLTPPWAAARAALLEAVGG
jgi:shikimate dehydrogenase